jgi:hypothetical protein
MLSSDLGLREVLPVRRVEPEWNGKRGLYVVIELIGGAAVLAVGLYALLSSSSKRPGEQEKPCAPSPPTIARQDRSFAAASPSTQAQPITPREKRLTSPPAAWIAAAVPVARAREVGIDPAQADALLTRATSWWCGSWAGWQEFAGRENLASISGLPTADADLIVVVYEVQGAGEQPLPTRFDAIALLRAAKSSSTVRRRAMYFVPASTKLTACGFSR